VGLRRVGGQPSPALPPADRLWCFRLRSPRSLTSLRQRRGTVVFVNSGAGITALPRNTAYAATKYALRALAKGLRQEEQEHGARVSSVSPGPTDTPWFKQFLHLPGPCTVDVVNQRLHHGVLQRSGVVAGSRVLLHH
jgi:NAD(P)-dependent dehydrogenase (short-subunit alcohol dehydrogenase family)